MRPARLAARCLELLGPLAGPVAVHAPARPRVAAALAAGATVARDGVRPAAAVVVFLGAPVDVEARLTTLRRVHAALASGAPLVVVDHNQPRTWGRRMVAAVALALRGHPPRRARHPSARELQAAGFTVARLRLADGERVQLILATHP